MSSSLGSMPVEPPEFIRDARADLAEQLRTARKYGQTWTWVGKRPAGSNDEVVTRFLHSAIWPFPTFEGKPLSAGKLHPVSRDRAMVRLRRCLHRGLAYDGECMDEESASQLASMFVGLISPLAAWWTNGFLEADREFLESGGRPPGSWSSMTSATFDSGVIGADSTSLAIAWVADED